MIRTYIGKQIVAVVVNMYIFKILINASTGFKTKCSKVILKDVPSIYIT
jgi:hypothetical protein